jgi:hypothetical protein
MPSIINSDDGVVSGTSGLKTTGGNDGLLNIQTNGSTAMSVNASQQVTFNNGVNLPNTFGFKNRIINGGMSINQRGTQTGVGGVSAYAVDRWLMARENGSQAARFTISSEALTSSDLPLTQDGQTYCQKIDVTTASGGISAGFSNYLAQRIEGYNIADISYGTASAKTLTLSFWLKTDNKTGVMSVSLYSTAGRNYIQTINATTSWQKFTLTFPGDTGGSILAADNSSQLQLMFVLSAGSDFYATTGQWNAGFDNASSSQADFTDSTSNNIYITGVQLERGSTATSFDFRSIGQETTLCYRYYYRYSGLCVYSKARESDRTRFAMFFYKLETRATPTVALSGTTDGSSFSVNTDSSTSAFRSQCSGLSDGSTPYFTGATIDAEL